MDEEIIEGLAKTEQTLRKVCDAGRQCAGLTPVDCENIGVRSSSPTKEPRGCVIDLAIEVQAVGKKKR